MPARIRRTVLAAAVATGLSPAAHAAPSFVNAVSVPGDTVDLSGLGAGANKSRVGFFSDIYYDPNRNEWWGLSDRGPGGGVLSYETRVQRFTIDYSSATGAISNFRIRETVLFKQGTESFNGLNPALLNGNPGVLGRSFDPEGFVVAPTGNFYVSDEYGPSVYEFGRNGQFVRSFTAPANLTPKVGADVNYVAGRGDGLNAGRQDNRGFEGIAMSPDGSRLFAVLQDPLVNEPGPNNGRTGRNVRIVEFSTATGASTAQYAYQLESLADINARIPGTANDFAATSQGRNIGLSAIVALNNNELLVLERDNRGFGVDPAVAPLPVGSKRVYTITLAGASDVAGTPITDANALPPGTTAVGKTLYLDLQAALAAGNLPIPEKIEGLAIGPKLDDGGYLILGGTDNDYSVTQNSSNTQFDVWFNPFSRSFLERDLDQPTLLDGRAVDDPRALGYVLIPGMLYAFRSGKDDFVYLAPVPEPSTYAMLLAGLGLMGFMARRRLRR